MLFLVLEKHIWFYPVPLRNLHVARKKDKHNVASLDITMMMMTTMMMMMIIIAIII
jgi:hypothetical protein